MGSMRLLMTVIVVGAVLSINPVASADCRAPTINEHP